VSGAHTPSPTHRTSTHADATEADANHPAGTCTDRPRRLPGLRTQAAIVALVPALLWAATHPALVATAVVSAAVTAVAMTLTARRRTRRPAALAE
jgi:hypothetical protein